MDAVVETDMNRKCDIEEKSMAGGIRYKQEHGEQTFLDSGLYSMAEYN